jgi:hypothetical protein
MATSNPLPGASAATVAATAATPTRLPLKVVCVVKSLKDAGADNLQVVKKFALEMRLLYETREYDSWKYNHDCDYIAALPAFHLYVHGVYRTTFYPDTRPLQIILDAHREFVVAEARRVERRSRRPVREFFRCLAAALKGLIWRQSALERAQAERTATLQRASVERVGAWSHARPVGTIRAADWE